MPFGFCFNYTCAMMFIIIIIIAIYHKINSREFQNILRTVFYVHKYISIGWCDSYYIFNHIISYKIK